MPNWKIIAAQLDLARQQESLSFLRDFIDLIADSHYNTLFLYLEDRIRTKSYPLASEQESYSPEEMVSLVSYAAARKIDIIPCVSMLGHAERFLRHPELADLAELHGGLTGRFGHHTCMDFCPQNEKVYHFLEQYLTEITAIFPSPFFHMGMDEVEQIGFCQRCSPIAATFEGEQELFLNAVLKSAHILRKLGKRPMLWNDMFDNYPDLLARLPKDLIMVDWQYQRDASRSLAHFMNLKVNNNLERLETLGFEYLIAPNLSIPNICSFTEFAEKYQPMGALLTSWEKGLKFQECTLPNFVYAGHLWHGDNHSKAVQNAIRKIFACPEESFNAAAGLMLETSAVLSADQVNVTLNREFFGRNPAKEAICRMLSSTLTQNGHLAGGKWGQRVLKECLASLRCRKLQFRLDRLFDEAAQTGWRTQYNEELENTLGELDDIRKERCTTWDVLRPGIRPCKFSSELEKSADGIRKTAAGLQNSARLTVRFCLPNGYGAENTRIMAVIDGKEQEVDKGCYKQPDPSGEAFYEKTFLLPDGELTRISFQCNGFGGQGLAYAEYHRIDGTLFVPAKVVSCSGLVFQPDNILENSAIFTWLGDQNMLGAFQDRSLAATLHSIVLNMKKTHCTKQPDAARI